MRGNSTLAWPDTATVPSVRNACVEHRTKTSLPDDVTRARSTSIRTSTLSPTNTGRSNLGTFLYRPEQHRRVGARSSCVDVSCGKRDMRSVPLAVAVGVHRVSMSGGHGVYGAPGVARCWAKLPRLNDSRNKVRLTCFSDYSAVAATHVHEKDKDKETSPLTARKPKGVQY